MPGEGRRGVPMGTLGRPHGLLLALFTLMAVAPVARAQCVPVLAEFVLTGLSRADGNRANHEVGICLPQFTINVTSSCLFTLRPKYSLASYVSLLQAGRAPGGAPNVPLAADSAAALADAVNNKAGYYYLRPVHCPQSYTMKIKGSKLLSADVATIIQRGLEVSSDVLPNVAFTPNGMEISWITSGPVAQELTYTAIAKVGGPTTPDFAAFSGTTDSYCSLLDINPAYNLDTNPADGVVDASTATLVGRVPRPVPGRPGRYVCAIAPAGGFVKVKSSAGAWSADPLRYAFVSDNPNAYVSCSAGGYLYKLGAISAPNDMTTDKCMQCPRGSFATSSASLCQPCSMNFFQDRPGQRSCKPCQYGYAPFQGAARCMACYYGRPYCSEGYTPNENVFTCNSVRLPDGYSPEAGFSVVRPQADPAGGAAAAPLYAPMFKNCNVRGGGETLIGMNVSAECKVDMYVLGDLGKDGGQCSQNAETNAISAYYTAPNMLAGMSSPGNGKWQVGIMGVLDAEGLATRIFATSNAGARVPDEMAPPTDVRIVLPESGWGYLGGGDNGQGQNANLKGINFDPCPAGTSREMLNGDGYEDPGEDPNRLLSDFCVPCGVGTFCPSKADSNGAENCPAGTFGPILGAKSQEGCVDCPVGTYQDMDGSYTCMTCASNTFASAPGATQCTACGDGYQVSSSGSNFCNPCTPGMFRDSSISENCQSCPPGTSSSEAAGRCAVCQPGTYAMSPKSAECAECPRGSYQRSYGQKKCELCPSGTYGDSRARSTCKVCPVGTFNKECGSMSSTACRRCPAGQAAPRPGSSECSLCGAGYFSDRAGMSSCRACPAGTYSGKKRRDVYSERTASKTCSPCPIGFFAPTTGAARCMSCPAGGFTASTGAWSCNRCQPGTYSTRSAASSDITCAACPPGSYSYSEGATRCLLCPAGQFADGSGATACNVCPLGSYSSGAGSQRCLPCRDGFTTAALGAVSAAECSVRVQLLNGK
ncbi:MAG: hypothetical protein J3K34DRAFT_525062 [Monoraphidium minutum]|nr:MAG: hypothetical protein J3K34DRAFT_525062 [Monoraphidium minutum]